MKSNLLSFFRYLLTVVIVSCFFFPFEFTFLPRGLNTKMLLSLLGVVCLVRDFVISRCAVVPKSLLFVIISSLLVSLAGFVSCVYNNTSDYAYASYFISFSVWFCAAYFCVCLIGHVHRDVSFEVLSYYLIAASVLQCCLALSIDMIPAFKRIVDAYIVNIFNAAEKGRMYGIGATLDVAGTRFAAVLLIISAIIIKRGQMMSRISLFVLFSAFAVIVIVGDMIGRTTIVGVLLSIVYLLCDYLKDIRFKNIEIRRNKVLGIAILTFGFFAIITIAVYWLSPQMKTNIEFAFEGVFSLFEKGYWYVASNDSLSHMWIFPSTMKTWILGDGYFAGAALDVNFLGNPQMTDFYMFTDIGYCRFLFYFGIVGLFSFILFFVSCTSACVGTFAEYSLLFISLLILNLIIWLKVSTDIFLVFSIFICSSFREHIFSYHD